MTQSPNSNVVTEGIRVQASADYLVMESKPEEDYYVYRYRIVITNEGDQPAKLLSRHWIILDADNSRQDVRGPGVVGQTPYLEPGENFEYMSSCPLGTSWGTMEGTYLMERDGGEQFEARIGRFFLVSKELHEKRV